LLQFITGRSERMKEYLKSWNNFEKGIFITSIFLILVLGLILKCDFLTTSVAFLGFFSALNQAKGKVLGQFTGVILAVLYSILSYRNRYFGEVIVYLIVILPLYTYGIFSWLKNKDKTTEKVKQNIIEKKEWGILLISCIILFIGLYQLLKYFDTNQLFVSTLSMIINITATYLLVRRSKYSFIVYIINAVILLILWGIPVLNGDYLLIPMVFDACLLLVNDIYGFKSWAKS